MKVYVVHAFRLGDRDNHGYIVGVYAKKHAALKAADSEHKWRGGKYECEVRDWIVSTKWSDSDCDNSVLVKPLIGRRHGG